MAGNEGSRILDLGATFKQGFPEVSQLPDHSDRTSQDKGMNCGELGEEKIFRNQSSQYRTPYRPQPPSTVLPGLIVGASFFLPQALPT